MGIAVKATVVALALALGACGGGESDPTAEAKASALTDEIEVLSVSPSVADAGVPTAFMIKVRYKLATKSSGIIYLGFNGSPERPDSYRLTGDGTVVSGGAGTITLVSTTSPVAHLYPNEFRAYANLSEYPHLDSWSPLASTVATIVVKPMASTTASAQAGALASLPNGATCQMGQCANASGQGTR
ncbi:MAG: hypothetical protein RI907_3474 [Pseudomonadota bacterium]|jgi:hypothetical protein